MEGVFKALAPELLRHCGRDVLNETRRVVGKRSGQQLKTIMGYWMSIILEELGYHHNDLEYIYGQIKMGMGFTENRVNRKTGQVHKVPKLTRDLPKDEYSTFMADFQDYILHKMQIVLPPPERVMARL